MAHAKLQPSEIFETFDENPVGTASLAQVHRATLKSTGETVAVKVQHLKVRNYSYVDQETMYLLVRGVKLVFPAFQFMWLADTIRRALPLELSFTTEGKHAERVGALLGHYEWLTIPEAYRRFRMGIKHTKTLLEPF